MVKNQANTVEELLKKNAELQSRLSESEEALNAIRNGEVDAIVVTGEEGEKIFSLTSVETPYRIILEEMPDGAVVIKSDGSILYCNRRFTTIFSDLYEPIVGSNIFAFVAGREKSKLKKIIREGLKERVSGIITYSSPLYNNPLHLNLSLRPLPAEVSGDVCIIVSDITELKQNHDYLEELVNDRTNEIKKVNNRLKADIIEIEKAKETLKESETKYRELIKYAPSGIYEVDFRTKKFTYVNDSMCILTGYSREEFLSITPYDILDDFGKKAFELRTTMWLAGEKPDEKIVYKIIAKDGHLIYALLNVKFRVDETGQPLGEMVVVHDITERKLSEEALLKNEKLLKSVLDNVNSGVALIDETGRFTLYNPLFLKLFGLSENSTIRNVNDQDWTEWKVFNEEGTLLHSDDHPVRKAVMTGKRIDQQIVGMKRPSGGEIIWMLISAEPISKDNGEIEKIICTFNDITKLKNAEKSLKETRNKLNIALENGNIGVWVWDLKTDEMIWDERMEAMFDLQPGSFGRTYKSFEKLIHEEDISHVQKAILGSIEKDLPYETIFRTRLAHGRTKYINSKALVNKDNAGDPVSFTGVCFDVTSLKEGTENLILRLNEELLRSNKELESFAYVASHDLQEPLRMVSSFTQLLEMQYKDKLDDNAQEYIHYAVDGALRMYELLNGLLSYSRIQTKGNAFRPVNMNTVLSNVLKNLSVKIRESNAVVKTSDLPVILADETQMIQLLQNLISNSIKFSPSYPKIFVSAESKEDYYLFSVRDKGLGIEPQYFDKIFQIFQRLLPREQYEGIGIGLAICKRIVERHGGKIWVESVYEKGSTFFFTIPNKA